MKNAKRDPIVQLEYFAANAPRERAARGVMFRWTMVGLGWLPFGCGVVSSAAVVRSGLAELVRVHVNAGAMFMAIGALVSTACCIAFARASEMSGAIVAGVSLIVQIVLFLCVGGVR